MINVGNKFGLLFLAGVRHPDTIPISAHGCFLIAIKQNEINDKALVCTFFDGYSFISVHPKHTAFNIFDELIQERNWKNMEEHDIYVSCHGMGNPKIPFWDE